MGKASNWLITVVMRSNFYNKYWINLYFHIIHLFQFLMSNYQIFLSKAISEPIKSIIFHRNLILMYSLLDAYMCDIS